MRNLDFLCSQHYRKGFAAFVRQCSHAIPCQDCCWEWQGAKTYGYGTFHTQENKETTTWRAHRVAWIFTYGTIPPGLCVCHRCDTPGCVNPAHLWLGTVGENNKDATRKKRRRAGEIHPLRLHPENAARGAHNGNAKLTVATVYEIRRLHNIGHSYRKIAAKVGSTKCNVYNVIRQRTWKYLP